VSAETLLRVPVARKHVRDKAEKHKTAIAGLFPEDNYEPANLEVIFALIQKPNAQLPFFSRLSLMRESEQIEHLGYKVAFQPIPRQQD
jgi:uncharacterized protein (TIGR04141 family)